MYVCMYVCMYELALGTSSNHHPMFCNVSCMLEGHQVKMYTADQQIHLERMCKQKDNDIHVLKAALDTALRRNEQLRMAESGSISGLMHLLDANSALDDKVCDLEKQLEDARNELVKINDERETARDLKKQLEDARNELVKINDERETARDLDKQLEDARNELIKSNDERETKKFKDARDEVDTWLTKFLDSSWHSKDDERDTVRDHADSVYGLKKQLQDTLDELTKTKDERDTARRREEYANTSFQEMRNWRDKLIESQVEYDLKVCGLEKQLQETRDELLHADIKLREFTFHSDLKEHSLKEQLQETRDQLAKTKDELGLLGDEDFYKFVSSDRNNVQAGGTLYARTTVQVGDVCDMLVDGSSVQPAEVVAFYPDNTIDVAWIYPDKSSASNVMSCHVDNNPTCAIVQRLSKSEVAELLGDEPRRLVEGALVKDKPGSLTSTYLGLMQANVGGKRKAGDITADPVSVKRMII